MIPKYIQHDVDREIGKRAATKVAIVFAPSDAKHADDLRKHLASLRRSGLIEVQMNDLMEADIVLLLLSASIVEWFDGPGGERLAERHLLKRLRLVPVRLHKVYFLPGSFLDRLQALPRGGPAIAEQRATDEAFADIARELRAMVAR